MGSAFINSASNFAQKILGSKKKIVWRVEGDDNDGSHYWSYVLVDEPKFNAFKKALDSGNIRVQDFGKVLAWGKGDNPPENIKQQIVDQYNIEIRE